MSPLSPCDRSLWLSPPRRAAPCPSVWIFCIRVSTFLGSGVRGGPTQLKPPPLTSPFSVHAALHPLLGAGPWQDRPGSRLPYLLTNRKLPWNTLTPVHPLVSQENPGPERGFAARLLKGRAVPAQPKLLGVGLTCCGLVAHAHTHTERH